jgi:hypothetical protein
MRRWHWQEAQLDSGHHTRWVLEWLMWRALACGAGD